MFLAIFLKLVDCIDYNSEVACIFTEKLPPTRKSFEDRIDLIPASGIWCIGDAIFSALPRQIE